MLSLMYVWWMILGINWGRSLIVPEFGAGSSPRRMASSRPVATRRPSNVQTLCTAKPSTRTVTRMNMVTPLRMVAVLLAALQWWWCGPPFLQGSKHGARYRITLAGAHLARQWGKERCEKSGMRWEVTSRGVTGAGGCRSSRDEA